MKRKWMMSAIGWISNSHIVEFTDVNPQKKSTALWVKIISAATCLALIIIAIPAINNYINTLGGSILAIPYVKINDVIYIIDSNHPSSTTTKLPEKYVVIGKIERNPSSDKFQKIINGDAAGCKVGEEIFQSPDSPNEIYVYTKLFSGSDEYRYVRFEVIYVQSTTIGGIFGVILYVI